MCVCVRACVGARVRSDERKKRKRSDEVGLCGGRKIIFKFSLPQPLIDPPFLLPPPASSSFLACPVEAALLSRQFPRSNYLLPLSPLSFHRHHPAEATLLLLLLLLLPLLTLPGRSTRLLVTATRFYSVHLRLRLSRLNRSLPLSSQLGSNTASLRPVAVFGREMEKGEREAQVVESAVTHARATYPSQTARGTAKEREKERVRERWTIREIDSLRVLSKLAESCRHTDKKPPRGGNSCGSRTVNHASSCFTENGL